MKHPTSFRLSVIRLEMLRHLKEKLGISQAAIVAFAIDNLYLKEFPNVSTNDDFAKNKEQLWLAFKEENHIATCREIWDDGFMAGLYAAAHRPSDDEHSLNLGNGMHVSVTPSPWPRKEKA